MPYILSKAEKRLNFVFATAMVQTQEVTQVRHGTLEVRSEGLLVGPSLEQADNGPPKHRLLSSALPLFHGFGRHMLDLSTKEDPGPLF